MDTPEQIAIAIPMPLLVCVEDVGWWSGFDASAANQPFRTGMGRLHCAADYAALSDLGRRLGMKILAGFTACEWDGTGLLKKIPTATWMGREWKPFFTDPGEKEEARAILQHREGFIEPALHGVGHEFWKNGTMERTEFHDHHCAMRNPRDIRQHLDAFFEIIHENRLPMNINAFIPPGLKHSFGNGDRGFQKILNEYRIRYVATVFDKALEFAPLEYPGCFHENGVTLIERGISETEWNRTAAEPAFTFDRPLVALHWANLLALDPEENQVVITRWADFLREGARKHQMVMARDMEHCVSQYLYRSLVTINATDKGFVLDLSTADKQFGHALQGTLIVRIPPPSQNPPVIAGADITRTETRPDSCWLHLNRHRGSDRIIVRL